MTEQWCSGAQIAKKSPVGQLRQSGILCYTKSGLQSGAKVKGLRRRLPVRPCGDHPDIASPRLQKFRANDLVWAVIDM
jgi:hypothetical protein